MASTNILPIGTYVVCRYPENSTASVYDEVDQSDLTVFDIEKSKALPGIIIGCFPLGFLIWGMNQVVQDAFANFIEEVKLQYGNDWRAVVMYIVRDRTNRFCIFPSGYIERDNSVYN